MISFLSPDDETCLRSFFRTPNGIEWEEIVSRTAPSELLEQIFPWLELLRELPKDGAVILPFVRDGKIQHWYAAKRSVTGFFELQAELKAWLGTTYLDRIDVVRPGSGDPCADALATRFGSGVIRFSGKQVAQIAARLLDYARLVARRPVTAPVAPRPVGAIRSDFDRALAARDSLRAEALIEEFRQTGRLNEENLRYLDVRLKAGLGYWEALARSPSLLRTLSDLTLPVQVLSDLIEALYRTYLEPVEAVGDAKALAGVFREKVGGAYPKLFSSRKGILSISVVKAFVLFEHSQAQPDANILVELGSILPDDVSTASIYREIIREASERSVAAETHFADASVDPITAPVEEALADEQFDRAFALLKNQAVTKLSLQRQIQCVLFIDTDEARFEFLARIEAVDRGLLASLPEASRKKIDAWRNLRAPTAEARPVAISDWMDWAEALARGNEPSLLATALERRVTWDARGVTGSPENSKLFADRLAGLKGQAEHVARAAVPAMLETFVPDDAAINASTRPIATLLFDLIALDERVTPTDLELLQTLSGHLLGSGLSATEYRDLLAGLDDVQKRIGSYSNLTWSLDIAEAVATSPAPGTDAQLRRREFFLNLVGQSQLFAHRMSVYEVLSFRRLCRDFDFQFDVLGKIELPDENVEAVPRLDLNGMLIGIYTLTEQAAQRARAVLLDMFPGVRVETNSDQVATARLTNLAKTSDIFIFAWKSSSHQAYYCVKEAMKPRDPLMPAGKGTASLVRAVIDSFV